jgi:hypothetical protein
VSKWRHRFSVDRLDGLVDAPRPGAARTISDEKVEAIVVETLEAAPPDATHWSTRGLAEKHGISHTTVGEIWRAFGLKLWRQDSFKVSPDPQLIEKIRDIVALYLNPPVAAGVFAVDEKPQIQALVNGEADDASLQRRGEEAGGAVGAPAPRWARARSRLGAAGRGPARVRGRVGADVCRPGRDRQWRRAGDLDRGRGENQGLNRPGSGGGSNL